MEEKQVQTEQSTPEKKKEKKPRKFGPLIAAVIFVAAMLLITPVGGLLNRLTAGLTEVNIDWTIPFRLIMLISGLVFVNFLLRMLFRALSPKSKGVRTAATLVSSALHYLLGIVGLLWGLAILGVDVVALVAGAGIVALIVGFGAESLIADVITGIFMIFEHQYEVGDIITVGDFRGTVTDIGIRTTSITDTGGNVKIINNSSISELINRSNKVSYAVCDMAIPYQNCLERAETLLAGRLPKLYEEDQAKDKLFKKEPAYLGVQSMQPAAGAIVLRIAVEVEEQDIFKAQRKLNREMLLTFEKAGIPNPMVGVKVAKDEAE